MIKKLLLASALMLSAVQLNAAFSNDDKSFFQFNIQTLQGDYSRYASDIKATLYMFLERMVKEGRLENLQALEYKSRIENANKENLIAINEELLAKVEGD